MTQEDLKTVYTRANQYALTKYGKDPDEIRLVLDGTLEVDYIEYNCGDRDIETYIISIENLTQDLDEVAKERKEKEEQNRVAQEKYRVEQRAIRETQEKERRKQQYFELKKEFES